MLCPFCREHVSIGAPHPNEAVLIYERDSRTGVPVDDGGDVIAHRRCWEPVKAARERLADDAADGSAGA